MRVYPLKRNDKCKPLTIHKKDVRRFVEKVDTSGDCHKWNASVFRNGYASFTMNGKRMGGHVFAYLLHKGDIPLCMCVCHECDNPGCVNPDHLWLGTYSDNAKDMQLKGRGRDQRGEKSSVSNLTELEVISIKKMKRDGATRHDVIKFLNHIPEGTINGVWYGKTWKHIS